MNVDYYFQFSVDPPHNRNSKIHVLVATIICVLYTWMLDRHYQDCWINNDKFVLYSDACRAC